MSWSVSSEPHPPEEIRGAIEHMEPPAHLSDDQLEQVRAAKRGAMVAINEGAIGPANTLEAGDSYFKAHLSGHAVDDHGAGEFVQVRLEKVSPPA